MKKLTVLLCVLCLVGCSNTKTEKITKVCTLESDGIKITNTLEAEDDKIIVQTTESSIDYSYLDVTEEMLKGIMDEISAAYSELEGVEYTYSMDGSSVNDKTVVDYTKADLAALLEAGILESEEEKINYVSLEQTVKALEEMGLTCK